MKLVWSKKHNRYVPEEDLYTRKELEEKNRRIARAMIAEECRLQDIEDDKLARGYCPKCNMLLPKSGECFCGYKKLKPKVTLTQPPQKNYVNPAILAMYKK